MAAAALFMSGCGVVIRKHADNDAIEQTADEGGESSDESTEVGVVFTVPSVVRPAYPYDINGFPHRSHRNCQPGACFVTVCY